MIELALRNISKSYGINEILKDISFEVRTNDVVRNSWRKWSTGKPLFLK